MSEESTNEGGSKSTAGDAAQYAPEQLQDNGKRTANGEINLDLVLDIPVSISLRVGSTEISIRDLVKLVEGSVIALDRDATEPMDLLVNGTLIARGEIVVVDERFGVRLTEVVSPLERIESLNQ
ncbi:MAG TPA: flagellar motor switch protein FliN [Woeseiaceae bacterium]|nr:flagellar motor switch protein FliN [Woeseiaceae bacterium]